MLGKHSTSTGPVDKELTGLLGEATNGLLDLCILNVIGRAYTLIIPRKVNPYKDLLMVGVAGFEPATPCSRSEPGLFWLISSIS
jgi:hypothetical protein